MGSGVGMTSFSCHRKFSRVVLAATIGMAVMIGCAGSFAQAADEDEDELLDTKIFRGILKGLGLRKDERASIEYRERSPLVLPASKELPRPEADAAAKKAAGWPDDPDIKRVKTRKEAERKRKGSRRAWTTDSCCPARWEVRPPPKAARPAKRREESAEAAAAPSTNAELGSKGLITMFGSIWAPKEEYVPFTGEPPRSSLIEPPPGYRTPSPTQPYGVGEDKWVAPVIDKNEPAK